MLDRYFTAIMFTLIALVFLGFATLADGCREESRVHAVERTCRAHGGVREWEGGDIGSFRVTCIDGTAAVGYTRESWAWPW